MRVQNWLDENGRNDVFRDLDPDKGIIAGEKWRNTLRDAALRREAILLLISPQ